MNESTQAVLFNAVPLLALAVLYLAVTAVLAPAILRERRFRDADFAAALMFPCVGVAALVTGVLVLIAREPLGGRPYVELAAILVAMLPAVAFFANWRERGLALSGARRAREAQELRNRHLAAVARLSARLAEADDLQSAASSIVEEVVGLFGLDTVALALVDADAREARYVAARIGGERAGWLEEVVVDLAGPPSGVATAVAEAAPFAVYDARSSAQLSRELVERTQTRSAAFVPAVVDGRVTGVLVAASRTLRSFGFEELSVLQALVSEAGLALVRTSADAALREALERERLVARISRAMRATLDPKRVLETAVAEVGAALGANRCFIRLGDPVAAEWRAEGVEPVGGAAGALPVSNLAIREGRTVAVADVATAPELADETLGRRETLLGLGSRAVLATPVLVHGRAIGVFAVHRGEAARWTPGAVALAEAVAGEAGLAVHTARLLAENERRLREQASLAEAARVLASEIRLEPVLQRLVDEVARLLGADAADCYLLDAERRVLRCAAVHGLDEAVVGLELAVGEGLSGRAIAEGEPVLSDDYQELGGDGGLHPAYADFRAAAVAPIGSGDEIRGVLGVGSRDPERVFSSDDARLLEGFARLASLALRNAQMYEESSRQAQVQRGFARIASLLGEPLSAAATLAAVAQAAAEALGGGAAAFLRPSPDGLELAGSTGLPKPLERLLARGALSDALAFGAEERRTLVAPAIASDERFAAGWRRAAADAGFRSLLAVPVEEPRAGRAGLVVVLFSDERRFTDADLELGAQLAAAASGALERSELYERERRSHALARNLANTARSLATELDPATVLDELVARAPAMLGADAASVRTLEGDELVVAAAFGSGAEVALDTRAPTTAWLVGDVVQGRAPVVLADVRTDDRALEADVMLRAGYRACAAVPLVAPDESLQGVLAVYARRAREWGEEELEALVALASAASAALANAHLYQHVALDRERSAAILANIADGIVAVDREGNVVLWNRAAEEITGVPAREAVGRPPAAAIGRDLSTPEGSLVAIRRGGEDAWLSVTEAVMTDPAGAVAGRVFAFRDISDERIVEQMKSDFVSTVSHELRTPLTSIYGFAETLLRQDVLFGEEERRTFLRYISSESERLTAIVDMLLSVAQVDTGDVRVQLARTDVGAVVAEVVHSVQEALGTNGHRFVVDVPSEPIAAEADRDMLRQVLQALLDNAVRYSPYGGTVTVAARRGGDVVEVRVADEGVGIPAGERERIFRKFYRAESAQRAGAGGTGLGLFIAEGLVAAMRGRIWVDSEEGRGSTFVFELPAAGSDT